MNRIKVLSFVSLAALAFGCSNAEAQRGAGSAVSAKAAEPGFETFDRRMTCLHYRREQINHTQLARGFHLKVQGCLKGQMYVNSSLEKDKRLGVFGMKTTEADAPYDHAVAVRFTNINKLNDSEADLHGLALKVLAVPGTKLWPGDPYEGQDFLMNDTRVHFLNNPVDVVRANEITDGAKVDPAADSPVIQALQTRARTQVSTPNTLLANQYHSRAPYAFGDKYIIRYFVESCDAAGGKIPTTPTPVADRQFGDTTGSAPRTHDHLKPDLVARAASDAGICMLLRAQFRDVEGSEAWIDDYITPWEETPVTLATLVFPKQDIADNDAYCKDVEHNPFHSIAEHKPVGVMNRGREYIYKASRETASRRDTIDDYKCGEIFPNFDPHGGGTTPATQP
jgi:hypothetical protein